MSQHLETRRLTLRPPLPGDLAAWTAFVADDRSAFVRADNSVGTAWRSFAHIIGHWSLRGFGLFVFTLKGDDRPMGTVGPWFPANWPEKELGWSVWSAEYEGEGYVREAAEAARDHAFGALGWTTAVSYIDPANARSIALAERLGAALDPSAATPDDEECLVYRHPTPEGQT